MRFQHDAEQLEIARTARALLTSRLSPERVRQLADADADDDALWTEIVGLGWPGIAIDEEHGGSGLGFVELTLLIRELGRTAAPVPFSANVLASTIIGTAGSVEQRADWLPRLADGTVKISVASLAGDAPTLALGAADADALLLISDDAALLFPTGEFTAAARPTIDISRRFSEVRVSGAGESLPGSALGARLLVRLVIAAETLGVADRALELAVEYAKVREQFGRPIGANQAVSHRCVTMFAEVESARAAIDYAAWSVDQGAETADLAMAGASSFCAEMGKAVCSSAIQVHGGIGFTWEHDLHLLLRRARTNSSLLGSARDDRRRLMRARIPGTGADAEPARARIDQGVTA